MKLYGHPMSTCTRKVLTTLAEKNEKADFVLVDIMKGDQKKPDYLAMHPFGQVPVIDDEGFVLYESRAIMRYLDAKLAGQALTPTDLKSRARMEQWISIEQSHFSAAAMKIIWQNMFVPMGGGTPDQDVITKGRADLDRTLDITEKALTKQDYLAGGTFSLADITWMPYVEYLFPAQAGDAITSRPNVASWWTRVSERASWRLATGKTGAAAK
jgi:glutathione S-transferase